MDGYRIKVFQGKIRYSVHARRVWVFVIWLPAGSSCCHRWEFGLIRILWSVFLVILLCSVVGLWLMLAVFYKNVCLLFMSRVSNVMHELGFLSGCRGTVWCMNVTMYFKVYHIIFSHLWSIVLRKLCQFILFYLVIKLVTVLFSDCTCSLSCCVGEVFWCSALCCLMRL